jgi:hypothetical protein
MLQKDAKATKSRTPSTFSMVGAVGRFRRACARPRAMVTSRAVRIPLCCLLLCFAGCAAPRFQIAFESDPPGARVFYTAGPDEKHTHPLEYVGVTPCIWELEGNYGRTFKAPRLPVMSDFVQPAIIFTAQPRTDGTNLFAQRVVYHSGAIAQPPDRIPEKVFFDLRKAGAEQPK